MSEALTYVARSRKVDANRKFGSCSHLRVQSWQVAIPVSGFEREQKSALTVG